MARITVRIVILRKKIGTFVEYVILGCTTKFPFLF